MAVDFWILLSDAVDLEDRLLGHSRGRLLWVAASGEYHPYPCGLWRVVVVVALECTWLSFV